MKRVAMLLLPFAFLFYADSARAQTIAHEILRMEFEVGAGEANIKTLDAWIDDLIKDARLKPSTGHESSRAARKNLKAVHRYLFEKKLVEYNPTLLFHEMLGKWYGDCDIFSFFYLAVAEKLNWPLYAVIVPNHMYVRWVGKNFIVNWDPNIGASQDEIYYLRNGLVHLKTYESGLYLHSLTRKQVIAVAKFNVAALYGSFRSDHVRAIEWASEAIKDFPEYADVYDFRAWCYGELGYTDEASRDLNMALALNPRIIDRRK